METSQNKMYFSSTDRSPNLWLQGKEVRCTIKPPTLCILLMGTHIIGPELCDLIGRHAILKRIESECPAQPGVGHGIMSALEHAAQLSAAGPSIERLEANAINEGH